MKGRVQGVETGRELEHLRIGLREGTLSRRGFVARALALGLGLGPIGSILAACRARDQSGTGTSRSCG